MEPNPNTPTARAVAAHLDAEPQTARALARKTGARLADVRRALRDLCLTRAARSERRPSFYGPGYSLVYLAA